MKYPKFVKTIFYNCLSKYYHWTGIADHKVKIKSIRSEVPFKNKNLPQREFYALNKKGKEMAHGHVILGRFQEHPYQYCILSGTFVKPLHRRRYLAEKLFLARVKFCEKEGFEFLLAPVEPQNIASQYILKKMGFQFDQDKLTTWMKAEVNYYSLPILIGVYNLKKPAQ